MASDESQWGSDVNRRANDNEKWQTDINRG